MVLAVQLCNVRCYQCYNKIPSEVHHYIDEGVDNRHLGDSTELSKIIKTDTKHVVRESNTTCEVLIYRNVATTFVLINVR
jgi:hypothetical protein